MSMPRVFIAGAGFMGHGIAQVCATAGCEVLLYDVNEEAPERALKTIEWSLKKLEEKGKTGPAAPILKRIHPAKTLEEAAGCEIVIEAVLEDEGVKRELFEKLGQVVSPNAILCSNTSAIPISRLAETVPQPERFCGLHFFAPVPLMPLVEVIAGQSTNNATLEWAVRFVEQIGKQAVAVRRDDAGFIVNRLLIASILEAVRLLERGVADAESIDRAMRLGCGHKMGPLETADLSGLDVIQHAADAIYAASGDTKYLTPQLMRDLVAQGRLGRKSPTGGFYPDPSK